MPPSEVHTHEFRYSFSDLSLSYLNRYPSPLSPHIISSDLLSVSTDEQGRLFTSKLVLKRGKLPRWAPQGLVSKAETYVLEHCVVDPSCSTLVSETRNLDHRIVLDVTEGYHLQATSSNTTQNVIQGNIKSSVGSDSVFTSLLRGRIESFGLSSFNRNVVRSRNSLLLIHSLLHHPESPYRPNILFRHTHPDLPPDLLEPKWAESLKRWQEFGAGFSGHGFSEADRARADASTTPQPQEVRRNRPEFLELGNWAWWTSRWRPHLPLVFYLPATLDRQPDEETRWQRFRRKAREYWTSTVLGFIPGDSARPSSTDQRREQPEKDSRRGDGS